jgi:hypothetical protein
MGSTVLVKLYGKVPYSVKSDTRGKSVRADTR